MPAQIYLRIQGKNKVERENHSTFKNSRKEFVSSITIFEIFLSQRNLRTALALSTLCSQWKLKWL